MSNYCPACGEEVVENLNSQDCEYLIIEEFPELVLPCPFYIDSESKDEKSKTVFRNARQSGKSLTMAGLK